MKNKINESDLVCHHFGWGGHRAARSRVPPSSEWGGRLAPPRSCAPPLPPWSRHHSGLVAALRVNPPQSHHRLGLHAITIGGREEAHRRRCSGSRCRHSGLQEPPVSSGEDGRAWCWGCRRTGERWPERRRVTGAGSGRWGRVGAACVPNWLR
jgi:hypothetical protein